MPKLKYLLLVLFCFNLLSPFCRAENSFLDKQVEELTKPQLKANLSVKANSSAGQNINPLDKIENQTAEKPKKVSNSSKTAGTQAKTKTTVKKTKTNNLDNKLAPVALTEPTVPETKTEAETDDKELNKIAKERKQNTDKTIDAINFIQPSLSLSAEEQNKIDLALTRSEQEQLTILWRSTLERNKTIHFIVQKLAPEDQAKKKNPVLSQVLNTAILLKLLVI